MNMHSVDMIMTDDEYCFIRDRIYDFCGIYFNRDLKYLLENRLSRRVEQLKFNSFIEYCHFLKYNPEKDQELVSIMDILTVNETYFFRESNQLQTFIDEVLPELIENNKNKRLRILSAGCSTGEEPYSIAMMLADIEPLRGWQIEITAVDISRQVLQSAEKGLYGISAFRKTDQSVVNRFFVKGDTGYHIIADIKKIINFKHLNIFDLEQIATLGPMDVIFCRNVIIYFDTEAKKKVVKSFNNILVNGGFLFLGHSETLMNLSSQFNLRHFKSDLIYQKSDQSYSKGHP